jgi:hypothetical protein
MVCSYCEFLVAMLNDLGGGWIPLSRILLPPSLWLTVFNTDLHLQQKKEQFHMPHGARICTLRTYSYTLWATEGCHKLLGISALELVARSSAVKRLSSLVPPSPKTCHFDIAFLSEGKKMGLQDYYAVCVCPSATFEPLHYSWNFLETAMLAYCL